MGSIWKAASILGTADDVITLSYVSTDKVDSLVQVVGEPTCH